MGTATGKSNFRKKEAWETRSPYSPFSVIITFLALMIAGSAFIPVLNVRFKPTRSQPSIGVSFSWPGASPEAVEEQASVIEGLLSKMTQVITTESTSSAGLGLITVGFDKSSDLNMKRFEVSSLLRQFRGKMPAGMSFPSINSGQANENEPSTFITLTLAGNAPTHYIGKIANQYVIPRLLAVDEIADVKLYGVTPYQWEVTFDPVKMKEYNLQPRDIANVLRQDNSKTFLGNYQDGKGFLSPVVMVSKTSGPEYWGSAPIANRGGRILRLGDIATVKLAEKPPDSYYRINGQNTVNLSLLPAPKANQLDLSKRVHTAIDAIRQDLPAGYNLYLAYDSSVFIRDELNKIGERTFFSLAILLLFVLLASRSFRILGVLGLSLAANLLIAAGFYYIFKLEIHLYSLAGITVSFGIIIDNSIIMVYHLRWQKGLKIFTALLASTMTVIGALTAIFFLKEEQKALLSDFALVMLINLTVSLGVALFLVPALMAGSSFRSRERSIIPVKNKTRNPFRLRRATVRFSLVYSKFIKFGRHYRWAFIVIALLGFGLPVSMLPDKIEKEGSAARMYNKSIGTEFFKTSIKPWLSKILGGSLRLFSEHVYEGNFYADPGKTVLYIRGKMPEGCTVHQLNEAIRKMEQYISQFKEIEMFETSVSGYANSSITINFTPEAENSSFPYLLKSEVEQKAISLGGMDWSVYGVGRGFSNSLNTEFRSSHILLTGYNYRQLCRHAELMGSKLKENPRVADVDITSSNNYWYSGTRYEYTINADKNVLALQGLSYSDYAGSLLSRLYNASLPPVYSGNELQPAVLASAQYDSYNKWDFYNQPVTTQRGLKKLSESGSIEKKLTGKAIYKKDQVYFVYVNYNFIGPGPLANMVQERVIKEVNLTLPIGYRAQDPQRNFYWNFGEKKQYWLLLLIITIIYFTCSILFESLLKPLAVVISIPISFIGVFLTFYLFGFNFDQGGFASFILLSGLVVNSAIYIINDFNNLVASGHPPGVKIFVKAFNQKIIPILLTILSTVLSLVPFVWGGQKEVFWFAFAVGAMGGLVFSVVAIIFYLPLFLRFKQNT